MNGMKNYLIHHGEEKLNTIIVEERSKVCFDDFPHQLNTRQCHSVVMANYQVLRSIAKVCLSIN